MRGERGEERREKREERREERGEEREERREERRREREDVWLAFDLRPNGPIDSRHLCLVFRLCIGNLRLRVISPDVGIVQCVVLCCV
jgi:hypothetical protein